MMEQNMDLEMVEEPTENDNIDEIISDVMSGDTPEPEKSDSGSGDRTVNLVYTERSDLYSAKIRMGRDGSFAATIEVKGIETDYFDPGFESGARDSCFNYWGNLEELDSGIGAENLEEFYNKENYSELNAMVGELFRRFVA